MARFTGSVLKRLLALAALAVIAGGVGRALATEAKPAAEKAEAEHSAPHEKPGHHEEPSLEDLDNSHANATPALGSPAQLKSDLAIYTFIVFLLFLAVLWKFAWGPIMDGLAKREQGIADQIAQANHAAAEAKSLLAEHQAKVASAASEVRQMIDEGRREAEASAAKIVAEAHAAAKRERETALSQIEAAKNSALRELAAKSVDTAISLAGQIVHRQLTPQDHAQLVREAVAQFPSQN